MRIVAIMNAKIANIEKDVIHIKHTINMTEPDLYPDFIFVDHFPIPNEEKLKEMEMNIKDDDFRKHLVSFTVILILN